MSGPLRATPGLRSGFLAHRDGVEAPDLASAFRFVGQDPAADTELTAGDPDDDQAVPGHRSGGDVLAQCGIAHNIQPQLAPRRRIECEQPPVIRAAEDPAAQIGDAAIHRESGLLGAVVGVLPLDLASQRIQGERVGGRSRKHRIADDDQTRLQRATRRHRYAADFDEACDVRYVDLVEKRVTLAIERLVVSLPVGSGRCGLRVCQSHCRGTHRETDSQRKCAGPAPLELFHQNSPAGKVTPYCDCASVRGVSL